MRYATIIEAVAGSMTGLARFVVGPAERCGGCGTGADAGKLRAVATDHRDMRNGHVLLCQPCQADWQKIRDEVAEDEQTSARVKDFFHAHVTGLVSELDDGQGTEVWPALLTSIQEALEDR